jgi:hypothetical protein
VRYVWFSLGFTAIHLVAYVAAGVVTQTYSKDLYHGRDALLAGYLRDVSEEREALRQGKLMFPAQLARGLLMSAVLWPLLGAIGELGFGSRAAVLGGLMFVYADLASAIPFPNTIEGLVYLRERFVGASTFWRLQSEAVIYSVLFGSAAAWLLF